MKDLRDLMSLITCVLESCLHMVSSHLFLASYVGRTKTQGKDAREGNNGAYM